ncbi:hypothetical protein [Chryseobacterium wangxinyae]|uniref:hypothetical protein n=1 Tax=Chryseobacterium sp. CY353 TaxID=2997334 RepID=UPI0022712C34|nr:hypothetical protein [Chryseobacterium sp. CY353]MCY0969440.1 hypothetical protein [Chryseobacterium sp. CY353]
MKYNETLRNLKINKANSFLSEQTLSFGKQTVIASAIIILLSFNFLSLETFEIGGVTMTVKSRILSLVLLLVNIYLFFQFKLALDVDRASFSLPDEVVEFQNQIDNLDTSSITELTNLLDQYQQLKNEIETGIHTDEELVELSLKQEGLAAKMQKLNDDLTPVHNSLKKDKDIASNFHNTITKYNNLNATVPQIAYYLSLIAIFIKTILFLIFFSSLNKPWIEIFNEDKELIEQAVKVENYKSSEK